MRILGSVVAGYVVMFLVVFLGLSLLWLVLGADGALAAGTYDVTTTWVAVSLVVGFIAALAGGWVARLIGRSDAAPKALAVLVLVLGAMLAIPAFSADAAESVVRAGAPPMFEAISAARTPLWVTLVNPILGAIGVLIGGKRHAV